MFSFFSFIDVSSGRVHLLIRTRLLEKHVGYASGFSCTRCCSDKKITGTVTLRLSLGRSRRRQRGRAAARERTEEGFTPRLKREAERRPFRRLEKGDEDAQIQGRERQMQRKEKEFKRRRGWYTISIAPETPTFCCRGLVASLSFPSSLFFLPLSFPFFLFFSFYFPPCAMCIDKKHWRAPNPLSALRNIFRYTVVLGLLGRNNHGVTIEWIET